MQNGTARRRVRRSSLRCIWPKCPRNRSDRYPRLPLCAEHARVVHHQVEVETAAREARTHLRYERTRQSVNLTRARNGLPPIGPDETWIGVVYFLRVASHIKIGHTLNLPRRMAAYPPDSTLLVTYRGDRKAEADLHHLFSAFRQAGREWYSEAPELMAFIDEKIAVHGKPEQDLFKRRQKREKLPPVQMRGRSGGRYSRKQAS